MVQNKKLLSTCFLILVIANSCSCAPPRSSNGCYKKILILAHHLVVCFNKLAALEKLHLKSELIGLDQCRRAREQGGTELASISGCLCLRRSRCFRHRAADATAISRRDLQAS
jgi:hypothetical protein